MTDIPTTESRKKFAKTLSWIVCIWALLTILAVMLGLATKEQVEMVGCTFDRWWVVMVFIMGIYTTGEIGSKHAYAMLNKQSN